MRDSVMVRPDFIDSFCNKLGKQVSREQGRNEKVFQAEQPEHRAEIRAVVRARQGPSSYDAIVQMSHAQGICPG